MANGIIIPNWNNIYDEALGQYSEALRQASTPIDRMHARSGHKTFVVWDTQSRRRYIFAIDISTQNVMIWAPMPFIGIEKDYPEVLEWVTARDFKRINHDRHDIKKACERLAMYVSNLYDANIPDEWIPNFYSKSSVRKHVNRYRQNCKSNSGCQYSYHNPWLD